MSTVTPNLKLFKYNTTSDSNIAFNINTALNNNWDIIDNLLPDQTDKNGYVLTTNGVSTSWKETTEIYCIIETYIDGESWYRVYSDGFCEQGGRTQLNETSTTVVSFLKAFNNTNYTLLAIQTTQSTASDTEVGIQFTPISNTQATLSCHYINPNTTGVSWYACGYIGA